MLHSQSIVIGVATRFSGVRGARADERPFAYVSLLWPF
jgi:hypothetical protein